MLQIIPNTDDILKVSSPIVSTVHLFPILVQISVIFCLKPSKIMCEKEKENVVGSLTAPLNTSVFSFTLNPVDHNNEACALSGPCLRHRGSEM